MPDTSCFPAWRSRFARPADRAWPAAYAELRRCTLDKLEDVLGPFLAGLADRDMASYELMEFTGDLLRFFSPREEDRTDDGVNE